MFLLSPSSWLQTKVECKARWNYESQSTTAANFQPKLGKLSMQRSRRIGIGWDSLIVRFRDKRERYFEQRQEITELFTSLFSGYCTLVSDNALVVKTNQTSRILITKPFFLLFERSFALQSRRNLNKKSIRLKCVRAGLIVQWNLSTGNCFLITNDNYYSPSYRKNYWMQDIIPTISTPAQIR